MRFSMFAVVCLLLNPLSGFADVTGVTVTSHAVVAGGQSFAGVAPPATAAAAPVAAPLRLQVIVDRRQGEAAFTDAPLYPPADPNDRTATLTVRDRFWDPPTAIERDRWHFGAFAGAPRVALAGD